MSVQSRIDRMRESNKRLNDPNTADNMEVRLALVRRMQAGEITLEEGQAELKRIKRAARKAGRPTWGSR